MRVKDRMTLNDYWSVDLPPGEFICLMGDPRFAGIGRRFEPGAPAPDENAVLFCGNAEGKREDRRGDVPILVQCLAACAARPSRHYVIVSGKSAGSIRKDLLRHFPPNVIRLYANNVEVRDARVCALPLGRDFRGREAFGVGCYTGERPHERPLCYGNFSLDTSPLRHRVYRRLRRRSWITFEHMGAWLHYALSHEEYYRRVAGHRFIISPEGIGRDCYRTWDALYLKTVPIVIRSVTMSHFADLPILFTRSYRELTPRYLERQYRRMLETEYNMDKLRWSYWENRIRADAAAIGASI